MDKYNQFYNSDTGKYEVNIVSSSPDGNGRVTMGSRHVAYIARQINKDLRKEQSSRFENTD